ncbi:GTP pyrophosphokinase [Nitrosomonas sp. ANs5]|uniref:GTP pyrophosphokinase n=1 Tax=Nitrosomonas sp. ANs5 TaxID=3423941 RepID=UPI003D353779
MNESDLKKAFEARKHILQKYGEWVTGTIISKLSERLGSNDKAKKYLRIWPTPRVKETDSFLEKALIRKPKSNPIDEITDQVGVRFIVLLLEDISVIGEIIKSTEAWSYSKDRDYEEERLNKPDYFSYQSDHYVLTNKEDFEFEGSCIPKGLVCEVQIRTILQHAYAEMAHSSDYKPSIKLPEEDKKKIRRSLAKGAALIETTDDVFREIQTSFLDYDKALKSILNKSSEIYLEFTGEEAAPDSRLSLLVADTYREQLKGISANDLSAWYENKSWVASNIIEKRKESVFYRDSVVIFLGWIICNYQTLVPKNWPLESRYLEDMYTVFGVSAEGLF